MRNERSGDRMAGMGLVLVLALAVGCSSERGPEPDKGMPHVPVANVARVVVTIADSLPADRRTRLEKVDGPSRLSRALESELQRAGKLDPKSPRVLDVVIDRYRLRSGATMFFAGLMAGTDGLGVRVTVREGDTVVTGYQTGAGTSGAFAGLAQESRFEKLAGAVAQRVVKQL